jgi:hypothetical protein
MAREVYSTRFVSQGAVSGGPNDAYTVPAGFLAVVKDMRITWGNVIASGVDAWFQTDDLTKLWRYTWAFTVGTPTNFGGTAAWWGMAAIPEGAILQVQTVAGTVDFAASGYLLQLP